ncbi:MAG: metal ABC transporter substrate-binding protein [Eubacteriales bacterium]
MKHKNHSDRAGFCCSPSAYSPRSAPAAAVEEGGGLSIVSTIFPSYDFARQITAGTDAQVTLLLQPGEEVHSFDPTSQDIIRIQNADLFLYVGGENDVWVTACSTAPRQEREHIPHDGL